MRKRDRKLYDKRLRFVPYRSMEPALISHSTRVKEQESGHQIQIDQELKSLKRDVEELKSHSKRIRQIGGQYRGLSKQSKEKKDLLRNLPPVIQREPIPKKKRKKFKKKSASIWRRFKIFFRFSNLVSCLLLLIFWCLTRI